MSLFCTEERTMNKTLNAIYDSFFEKLPAKQLKTEIAEQTKNREACEYRRPCLKMVDPRRFELPTPTMRM